MLVFACMTGSAETLQIGQALVKGKVLVDEKGVSKRNIDDFFFNIIQRKELNIYGSLSVNKPA